MFLNERPQCAKIGVSAFCTCIVYCLSDFDEFFFYEFFMKIPFRKRQYFVVSQTYVRSPLGQRKSDLLKTVDSVKEVKFIWNFLWQDKKKVTFLYRCLFNRGDLMGKFDYYFFFFLYAVVEHIYFRRLRFSMLLVLLSCF